jgi:hypothetical protein
MREGRDMTEPRPRRRHTTPKKDKRPSEAQENAVQQSDSERRIAWLASGQLAVSLGQATPEQWIAFAKREAPDLFDPESPEYHKRVQAQADTQADTDTAGEVRPDERGSTHGA